MRKLVENPNRVDWKEIEVRYNAAYEGRTDVERLILRQMTDAWVKTRHIESLRLELLRKSEVTDIGSERKFNLELAAYAESALAHWRILGEMLATSPEGVAAAMDAEAEKMRRVGWIAPTRACLLDYRTLVALRAKR